MKTDEYVPTIIPITSANENPFSTWPPNNHSDSAVKQRQTAGQHRPAQGLIHADVDQIVSSFSRRRIFRFSRIRSNITMVSFIE